MRDDWYGHRDWFTGEPEGDKDEWLDWDHALADAFQHIESFTDSHGLLIWEREDEAVVVEAVRQIDPFEAAKEITTSGKNYKPQPGEYFVPRLKSRRSGGGFQTYEEWVLKDIAAKLEDGKLEG